MGGGKLLRKRTVGGVAPKSDRDETSLRGVEDQEETDETIYQKNPLASKNRTVTVSSCFLSL